MRERTMTGETHRSAREVFDDHLREGKHGSVEDDLARNYAEDVVILTGMGIYRGHDGVRRLAELIREQLPEATLDYRTQLVADEMAFLEWTGRSERAEVRDGADSFLIRDGRIVVQTIHYTVQHREADQ
jgi:hypothetical protein